ncbi:hypothetical protein L1I79_31225 [Strepomyces sp. STD 3.1]|uniref:hypothetical protein n=1 Tax=Streptomyces sp. NPDC058985 TaxID=3346684 RepID=UPI001F31047C|nr:hypothetical protein [Streptomyces sp. STD 3.1]
MNEGNGGHFSRWRRWWRRRAAAGQPLFSPTSAPGHDEDLYPSALATPMRAEVEVDLGEPENHVLRLTARDGVFEFEILPSVRLTSHDMSEESLNRRRRDLSDAVLREILRRAWPIARSCDPDAPAEAETLINAEIADGWCYERPEGVVKCRPTVRVRVDPVLRDRIRPIRLEEQVMREEHRLGILKASHAQALTETWLEVLRRLEGSDELTREQRQFLVPFVASLSDKEFAAAAKELRTARRQGAKNLADVLQQAARNHEQIGLFEFAKAYDKALNSFSQQMGLGPATFIPAPADHAEGTA